MNSVDLAFFRAGVLDGSDSPKEILFANIRQIDSDNLSASEVVLVFDAHYIIISCSIETLPITFPDLAIHVDKNDPDWGSCITVKMKAIQETVSSKSLINGRFGESYLSNLNTLNSIKSVCTYSIYNFGRGSGYLSSEFKMDVVLHDRNLNIRLGSQGLFTVEVVIGKSSS